MRIGFIGLGIHGQRPMCYNIIRKHDGDVYIYDVKTEPNTAGWRKKVVSPVTVPLKAAKLGCVITMLPRIRDSLSVYKEILPARQCNENLY